jgi:nucleoside 2-deoxyribosyltransferase
MTKIYLSARLARQPEVLQYAARLKSCGFQVVSSWHNSPVTDDVPYERRWSAARDEFRQIQECDIFIAFTDTADIGYSTGGRHVELGMAIACGKEVYRIGLDENIFHTYCEKYYSFNDFLRYCGIMPFDAE